MWTSWKFWSVWLIILGVISLLAFGFTTDPKKVPSPLIGKPAPNFQVDELNGKQKFSLGEFKGKPIVLNFWASWCAECRTEAIILEDFFQKYGENNKKLVMIGIAIQDSPKKAKAFAKHFEKTYLLGLDDDAGNIALDYGIYGVPETFFIDSEGNIFYKTIGTVTTELMEQKFKPLLR
tara:strand:+ start:394 stop:927 length:534 start_codon:yes stop_codon:yes gene_type:complete